MAELRYEGGKAYLFVAVDRISKLVFARIYRKATKLVAAGFLKALLMAVPYRIHTVLTDNGVQFDMRGCSPAVGAKNPPREQAPDTPSFAHGRTWRACRARRAGNRRTIPHYRRDNSIFSL